MFVYATNLNNFVIKSYKAPSKSSFRASPNLAF